MAQPQLRGKLRSGTRGRERVFIRAIHTFMKGGELFIDYQLQISGRRTTAMKRACACRCGSQLPRNNAASVEAADNPPC